MSAVPRFPSETPQTASVRSPLSVSVDRSQSCCGGSMRPHCTPPGERTLFSLLCAAMQPLGTTLYVYGGGWNLDDTGAGREAVTPFPSPAWKTFFLSQDEGYDYRRFRGSGCNPWHGAGLDCSGYLGWVIYAALHRKSGLESYVYPSTEMAGALAARGLGRLVRPPCRFLPGDLFSMEGHIWLCVGVCRDESLVIAHSSPTPSRRTGSSSSRAGHRPEWHCRGLQSSW